MDFEKPKLENEPIPEQERELVERLEKAPLDINDKIEFLLTWKELKLADDISVATQSWKENEPPKHLDLKRVEQLKELAKDMELFCIIGPKQIVDGEYFYKTEDGQEKIEKQEEVILYLAKKKENLDLLMKAIKTEDDQLLGKLYRFPESAIEAYRKENETGKKETIDVSDLPSEIQKQDSVAFARFKLSKDDWQEELKTGKKWAETVKKTSPKLCSEFIEFMSKTSK